MADHTPSPPQDTFSTIAEGYGGAQQTLARLGFLPGAMPGSFSPSDRNGTAVQFPTPPPPRFPTVVSTTLPFPAAAPQFAGAASPQPPSVLPPMFSTPQPTFTQGMPSANYSPQAPSFSPAAAPQAAPYPFGVPTAAPNWTRAFTQPMQGFGHPGAAFGGGSLFSDAVQAGYVPRPMFMEGPGTGVNTMQQRAGAGLRMNQRFEDWGASAISGASIGIGAIGGAAALGIGGATLGGIASAAGLIAAPMMAASAWTGAYQDERAGTRAVQNVFSGMSMGPMMSPLGQGINPMAARQIQNRFKESTHDGDFTSGDMFSTMGMAQESGLMRGHTNSVDQVVTRVKELAKVTKSIMDLGQGITQQDAIELQAIASNMGIGTSQFASQGIGKKLVTAARATGQTVQDVMSGVGASGASLFAQAGMNAGSGMMVGVHTAGVSAGMVNSGMFSPRELSALGGESGIQNTMAQGIARFQAQNAGNMMRGMLTGPDALHFMQTGTLSMADASKKGGAIFKDQNLTSKQRKLAAQFFDEAAPDMLSEMQEQMTPERMQSMQIAQANALIRNSKGTMSAHTAFSKVTGSDEGARVLMKLMENPEILRAQSAQRSLAEREANNRLAASYDDKQGFVSKAGKKWSGFTSGLMDTFGVNDAATWAAKQDYTEEALAAGVDPGSYRHKYKSLVNSDALLADVTAGNKSFLDAIRGVEASAGSGGHPKFSDRNKAFARSALVSAGVSIGGSSGSGGGFGPPDSAFDSDVRGPGSMTRFNSRGGSRQNAVAPMPETRDAIFESLSDASSSAFIMDEYKRYSEDPDAAVKFIDNLGRSGGTPGNVGSVMSRVADEVAAEVRKDPTKMGKILSTSALKNRISSAVGAENIELTDTQWSTVHSEFKQRIAAGMHMNSEGDDDAKESYAKVAQLADAIRNSDSGLLRAEDVAESYAKEVTGATGGYLKEYADSKRHWYSSDSSDNSKIESEFTDASNLMAGSGLKDKTSIEVLLSTGGSREELAKIKGSASASREQKAAADKIWRMNREDNAALFDMAKDQRKRIIGISGDVGSQKFKDAISEVAGANANQIDASGKQGAYTAMRERMVEAGLLTAGSNMTGSQAIEEFQGKARNSTALTGRQLAQDMLGDKGIAGGSFDILESDFNALARAKRLKYSQESIDKISSRIAQKSYEAKVKAHNESADGATNGRGDVGGGSAGDAGTDVAIQNLQEMREYNKQAFEALKTLTTTSQQTVDSMKSFISAVQSKIQPKE